MMLKYLAIVLSVSALTLSSARFPNLVSSRIQPSNSLAARVNQDIDRDPIDRSPLQFQPHRIVLANGKAFNLNLPKGWQINVAAQGLKRVRFMAKSPDDRIFVTDMFDLTDNTKGAVYILDGFDRKSGKFNKITTYLTRLRNPNSVAFYVDPKGTQWLYLALTNKLVRYRYQNGDNAPSSPPQVLATFPDYGLSYKYGGWHLTRTIAIADEKLYVSVGSSCNACEEKEAVRASIVEMDLDGKNQRSYAQGLRNAVGLKWLNGQLFATNMGADHLGDDQPEETFYRIENARNYGWPYCFQYQSRIYADEAFQQSVKRTNCNSVPIAYATFGAHSSPLGLEYFGASETDRSLKNYFLVALHGGSKISLNRGYRVVRVKGTTTETFIDGFLQNRTIYGRPVDVLSIGKNAFLLTDDYSGVVYHISNKG